MAVVAGIQLAAELNTPAVLVSEPGDANADAFDDRQVARRRQLRDAEIVHTGQLLDEGPRQRDGGSSGLASFEILDSRDSEAAADRLSGWARSACQQHEACAAVNREDGLAVVEPGDRIDLGAI